MAPGIHRSSGHGIMGCAAGREGGQNASTRTPIEPPAAPNRGGRQKTAAFGPMNDCCAAASIAAADFRSFLEV